MTREVDCVPTVIHEHTTAGDGGIAPPIRVIGIGDGAILDSQGFDLDVVQASDGA